MDGTYCPRFGATTGRGADFGFRIADFGFIGAGKRSRVLERVTRIWALPVKVASKSAAHLRNEPRRHQDTKTARKSPQITQIHAEKTTQRRRDAETQRRVPDVNRPGASRSEARLLGARKGPLRTQAFLTSPFPAPRRACGAATRPRISSGSMTTVCRAKRKGQLPGFYWWETEPALQGSVGRWAGWLRRKLAS